MILEALLISGAFILVFVVGLYIACKLEDHPVLQNIATILLLYFIVFSVALGAIAGGLK